MASKIVLKKSAVPAKIPNSSDLEYGELAINYADGKLYYKNTSNVVHSFTEGSTFTYGSSTPSNPSAGDRWIDSTTAIEYTFIDDGDSTQWIETGGSVTPSLPIGGGTGHILIKASDNDYDAVWSPQTIEPVFRLISTTDQTTIDSWYSDTYRSSKYIVQITQGTNYQISELMVIHDDTTTYRTEYAALNTGGVLGTLTTDLVDGEVRLRVTMSSAATTTINIKRILTVV